MSYTFLLEQGEESSAASFSDIPAFVLSRSTHTAAASCSRDSATECCPGSQFGTTSPPSTELAGAGALTSCAGDSHARGSVPPAKDSDCLIPAVACGPKWRESSARYDLGSHSWKTAQCLFPEDSTGFSPTLPKWGTMRGGELWEPTTPVLLTAASASGLWPTPLSSAGGPDFAKMTRSPASGITLQTAVAMWPTPTVACATGGQVSRGGDRKGELLLAGAVKMFPTPHGFSKDGKSNGPSGNELGRAVNQSLRFPTPRAEDSQCAGGHRGKDDTLYGAICRPKQFPTPTAQDAKNNGAPSQMVRHTKPLNAEIGGSLNPSWVEWLMGWPIGWTDCAPLAMDKFQQWLRSHGGC